jgi:hypothetical protein
MNPPVRSLEARRAAFSVALAIFWRMHSEAQLLGTVAPGHDEYEAVCGTARLLERFEPSGD